MTKNSAQGSRRTRYYGVLFKVALIGVFAALAFLSTTFLRIPLPVSGGYFNVGDTFVMASAALFGPTVGFWVGLIGPTLSDAIGYPQFIPATAIIKSFEGLIIGWICYSNSGLVSPGRCLSGLGIGGTIIVAGYFLFEAYIYPVVGQFSPFFNVTNLGMAVEEIVPNFVQAGISVLLAFGMWKLFKGRSRSTQ